jgi:hypothetical protein
MDKGHILREIQRTAAANGGEPLGRQRFFAETGIKQSDCIGVHWVRWNDALREAGFAANEFTRAIDKEELLQRYAQLALELGRIPLSADLRIRARNDPGFPAHTVFGNRLGSKLEQVRQLAEFCRERVGYEPVLHWCDHYTAQSNGEQNGAPGELEPNETDFGFVYLMKSGRHYKIGHSNSAGRREYELAIQLPDKLTTVHTIRTDDPPGIEAYWHNRFKDKRKNGEWFELNAADVAAFKRRKFM